jgi:hypothetical protein
MVPFFTLIAVTWSALAFGFCYIPVIYRIAKRRFGPRIRGLNGEHCTPRGGAVFANDAECPICLETLRDCQVRAERSWLQSAAACRLVHFRGIFALYKASPWLTPPSRSKSFAAATSST